MPLQEKSCHVSCVCSTMHQPGYEQYQQQVEKRETRSSAALMMVLTRMAAMFSLSILQPKQTTGCKRLEHVHAPVRRQYHLPTHRYAGARLSGQ